MTTEQPITAEAALERMGPKWSVASVRAEMLAVAVACLDEDSELADEWPIDCRAQVDRWQAVIFSKIDQSAAEISRLRSLIQSQDHGTAVAAAETPPRSKIISALKSCADDLEMGLMTEDCDALCDAVIEVLSRQPVEASEKPQMKLQVTAEWLREKIKSDPDVEVEARSGIVERCHADRDGDCNYPNCPQLRDKEPATSGRHCPIDTWHEVEDQ